MRAIIALALIAPIVASCATITRGTKQAFTVETEPAGASVETSLGLSCEATPCTFADVPRESEFTVTVSKPGYRTTTHQITHNTASGGSWGMAGNVLVGGIIGAAVDGNNGATQDLVPNPLRVTMEAEAPAAAPVIAAEDNAEVTPTTGGSDASATSTETWPETEAPADAPQ